jgi:hypothetical protein
MSRQERCEVIRKEITIEKEIQEDSGKGRDWNKGELNKGTN